VKEDLGLLLYEGQVRAARETMDVWRTKPRDPMEAASIQGLVPPILQLAEFPGQAAGIVLRRLEVEEMESIHAAGARLRGIFDSTLRLLEEVDEMVRAEQARGHTITGAEKLHRALAALRSQRDAVMQNWPWDDRPWPSFAAAITEASREALARKQVLTLQEFASELGRSLD
jgi:hypothetical protein